MHLRQYPNVNNSVTPCAKKLWELYDQPRSRLTHEGVSVYKEREWAHLVNNIKGWKGLDEMLLLRILWRVVGQFEPSLSAFYSLSSLSNES